jgi:hypothetical protein
MFGFGSIRSNYFFKSHIEALTYFSKSKMASAELVQLMDQDIPEGRRHLKESYSNLEKVAQYCQENYLQVKHNLNVWYPVDRRHDTRLLGGKECPLKKSKQNTALLPMQCFMCIGHCMTHCTASKFKFI